MWFPGQVPWFHHWTWYSPDRKPRKVLDHILISSRWKPFVTNCRVYRGAQLGNTDHRLLIAHIRLKLKNDPSTKRKVHMDSSPLKDPLIKEIYTCAIVNRYNALASDALPDWLLIKTETYKAAQETLGRGRPSQKQPSQETLAIIENRRAARLWGDLNEYRHLNGTRNSSIRQGRERYWTDQAAKVEAAAERNDQRQMHSLLRQAKAGPRQRCFLIKDSPGNIISTEADCIHRWKEHLNQLLNHPPIPEDPTITEFPRSSTLDPKSPRSKARDQPKTCPSFSTPAVSVEATLATPPHHTADETTNIQLLFHLGPTMDSTAEPFGGLPAFAGMKINKELRDLTGQPAASCLAAARRIRWYGHVLRLPPWHPTRALLDFVPEQAGRRRPRGLHTQQLAEDRVDGFTKAFDKVPYGRLVSKLEYYGIQGPTLIWLKAFLTNREQTVVVEGKAPAPVKVASGVPQGTVLGPLLFLLYINDLPDQLDSNTDSQLLQKDLNTLEEWQSEWLMQFNPEKCSIMHITNKRTPHATSYQFCGQALATTKTHPYLGVTLTSGLKWGGHFTLVSPKPCAPRGLNFALYRSGLSPGAAMFVSSNSDSESSVRHKCPLDPRKVLAYSHQPRWSDDKKKKESRESEEDEGGEVAGATAAPADIPAVSVAEWDGRDVETEGWRLEDFKWCRCGNCRQMKRVHGCVCCHDLTEAEEKGVSVCGGPGDLSCLIGHDRFYSAVIAEDVLSWQIMARAMDTTGQEFSDPITDRAYRFQAYLPTFFMGGLGKAFAESFPLVRSGRSETSIRCRTGPIRGSSTRTRWLLTITAPICEL
ncbi:hypothetical protein Bbelb_292920 [Branchiostoma belcheri]|nr:hypothetical protein Bbelb_292920 [Branchiostoma belcheri]